MKYSILIFSLLIIVCSCNIDKGGKATSKDSFRTLKIDLSTAKYYNLENLIDGDDLIFVQLETSLESYLGRFTDRFYAQDSLLYFISDNRLVVFNDSGKHQFTLSKQGKGPGEYHSISDVRLFNDHFYILDGRKNNILKYSKTGTYISNFKLHGLTPWSFYILDDDTYCFYTMSFISERSRHRINLYSKSQNKILAQEDSISENETKWRYFLEKSDFTKKRDEVLLNYACNNTIFSMSNSQIKPYMTLDWGKQNLPEAILKSNFEDITDFTKSVQGEFIYGTTGIYSTNTHLSFGVPYDDKIFQIIYNWDDESLKIIEGFDALFGNNVPTKIDYFLLPQASDNEYHYLIFDHYLIEDKFESPNSPPILKNIDINKNPIIVKIKYKI